MIEIIENDVKFGVTGYDQKGNPIIDMSLTDSNYLAQFS